MRELVNLGSMCVDCVYSVPSTVRAGETLLGGASTRHAGGKGLNQSLAAARAGARVARFGCVGLDGTWLTDLLAEAGIDVDGVRCSKTHPTGHAMIQVGANGENAIVVVAGANHHIQPDDVARAIARVGRDGWLLLQNEINDIDDVLAEAKRAGIRVALNIAPIDVRASGYQIDAVELLLLNEFEATVLAGEADPHRALERLTRERPLQHIVVTLGVHGVLYGRGSERMWLPAFQVTAVDETGAGDAFIGHLMAAWFEDMPVRDRLLCASAAGALTVCLPGAAQAIPDAATVQSFLTAFR